MARDLLILVGIHVIIAGIFVIIYQVWKVSWTNPPQRRVGIPPGGLRRSFPGLAVLGLGAAFIVFGARL